MRDYRTILQTRSITDFRMLRVQNYINLVATRNEQNNLVNQYPELVTSMREALEAWLASVVRSLNGSDYR